MNIEKRALAELSPAPYNPRKDLKPGDPEFEKLKRSIEAFGYVEPIIVNDRTGKIVGGHQRLKVLQAMGETEAECVIVDLSETEEKALNIALNKVNGDWDEDKLEALMRELEASAADITLTGFDARELEKMFGVDVTVKEDTPPENSGGDRHAGRRPFHSWRAQAPLRRQHKARDDQETDGRAKGRLATHGPAL